MTDSSARLEGSDWQAWATQLLQLHYGPGQYQVVPDGAKGDAGIEGFALSGEAYQMYGPRREDNFRARHNKMRAKIHADTEKFVANGDKLRALLGELKIKRWILLVPDFDSRALVEYAAQRTQHILDAHLGYVDENDFRVVIQGEMAFAVERAMLLGVGVQGVLITSDVGDDSVVDDWTLAEENSSLVQTLDDKLSRIPSLASADLRARYRRATISQMLHGQNIIEGLRAYPEIWATIRRIRSEREKYVFTACMTSSSAPGGLLREALNDFIAEVREAAPGLASATIEAIAHEVVADWLMRCPLDFPQPAMDDALVR